jgi:Leucine-rich repeat (LRR) protein
MQAEAVQAGSDRISSNNDVMGPAEMYTLGELNEKILDLSCKSLRDESVVFSRLSDTLVSLNISLNNLTAIPSFKLPFLTFLDLSKNKISNCQFSGELPSLDQLILNFNNLSGLDFCQCFPLLSVLCVSSNNIELIDASIATMLPNLTCLDLSNNNIKSVPPDLGLMKLSSLQLMGNSFRVPRPALLQKGNVCLFRHSGNSRIP